MEREYGEAAVRKRVAKGAAWLDERDPKWYRKATLKRVKEFGLFLGAFNRKVWDDYVISTDRRAVSLGFHSAAREPVGVRAAAWVDEINARRAPHKVAS